MSLLKNISIIGQILLAAGSIFGQNGIYAELSINKTEYARPTRLQKALFPLNCKCRFRRAEKVTLIAKTNSSGNVYSVTLLSGNRLLRPSTKLAAKEPKFTSSRISNIETGAIIQLTYTFSENRKIRTSVRVDSITMDPPWLISCSDCLPSNRKPIHIPKPEYPQAAKAVNAKGTVEIRVVITEKGDVINARPLSGHPLLLASALVSAKNSKFVGTDQPTRIQVKTISVITYNFSR